MTPPRRTALLRISAISLANCFPIALFADNASTLNALPRTVLVIGNSNYRNIPPLKNPANDAAALGSRLKEMGFAVNSHLDTGKAAFEVAVQEFCARIERAPDSVGKHIPRRRFLLPSARAGADRFEGGNRPALCGGAGGLAKSRSENRRGGAQPAEERQELR